MFSLYLGIEFIKMSRSRVKKGIFISFLEKGMYVCASNFVDIYGAKCSIVKTFFG